MGHIDTRDTPPTLHDYVALTRDAGKILTTVTIHTPYQVKLPKPKKYQAGEWDKWEYRSHFEWLRFSQCSIRRFERHDREVWQVSSYLLNATDFEHDPARVLSFEVVGLKYTGTDYGRTSVSAWIKSDSVEDFRVPPPDYNPLTHKDVEKCKGKRYCKRGEPHLILPEGFYLPKPNVELFEQVRGSFIELTTGQVDEG